MHVVLCRENQTWGTLRFLPSMLQRAQALSFLSRLASASRLLGMTKGRATLSWESGLRTKGVWEIEPEKTSCEPAFSEPFQPSPD